MDGGSSPATGKVKILNLASRATLQERGVDVESFLRDFFEKKSHPVGECSMEEKNGGCKATLTVTVDSQAPPLNFQELGEELSALKGDNGKTPSVMQIGSWSTAPPPAASSDGQSPSTSRGGGAGGNQVSPRSPDSWSRFDVGGSSSSSALPGGGAFGGKGGGKSGRGGKRAGRSSSAWGEGLPHLVKISKSLTQILRHSAQELDIPIAPDGFCPLDAVLATTWLRDLECTEQDIRQVVHNSDKKRFELRDEEGKMLIRAVQGHSMKIIQDDELLHRLSTEDEDLPALCVHGTYHRHFTSIMSKGLLAGGDHGQGFRNHIHFAPYEPGDRRVISGMRYDCEVALYIDLRKCLADGIPFYISVNEVILTSGSNGCIDPKYFLCAKDLRTGSILHGQLPAAAARPQEESAEAQDPGDSASGARAGALQPEDEQKQSFYEKG